KHAGWLARQIAIDLAPRRVGGVAGDARAPQGLAAHPDRVTVVAPERDGIARRGDIQNRVGWLRASPEVVQPATAGNPGASRRSRGRRGHATRYLVERRYPFQIAVLAT